eukprot:m.90438 g.90438  ORF g.90438 m.90438 type:complete len:150 (+) comp8462_c0_seq1:79-528(+)
MAAPELRFVRATPELAFGPQPTAEELAAVSTQFKAVLNLRSREETGYADESTALATQGVSYRGIEWKEANDITEKLAAEILEAIHTLPKPLFVHCAVGYTAAWAVLASVCRDNGLGLLECMRYGAGAGFDFSAFPNMYSVLKAVLEPAS